MKVNTHGIKMKGLRAAVRETKGLDGRAGKYVQISYDREDGEVLTNFHVSLGMNSWTQYHSPSIIAVCNTSSRMKMQEIADAIIASVTCIAEWA